jgi:hypothetical protein
MYCSACGNPLSPGLSYCNRCGLHLREHVQSKSSAVNGFLTAITLIAVGGLGVMLGGAMAMKNEAHLSEVFIAFFMLFAFVTVTVTEVLLIKQLSRFSGEAKQLPASTQIPIMEMPGNQVRKLAEPVASVTENTTRTLGYARHEPNG